MRFGAAFRFEFAYQVRRPWPWLVFVALVVFAFLMTRDGTLAEALYDDFFINSPFAVAKTTVAGGLLWLLMAASIAGEAAARDVATGMHPLTWTQPVSKLDYLGGRFLAALLINAVLLLALQLGIALAVYLPGVDARLIGPFRLAAYLNAYAFLSIPNAFLATAIQFSLAARAGRPMASYLGSLALLFMGFFVAGLLLFRRGLGKLLDPIGVRFVLDDLSHLWTTTEKSWRLIALEGTVLQNRLFWLSVALATLVVTYRQFHFTHRIETAGWRPWRRLKAQPPSSAAALTPSVPISVPTVPRTFGAATIARQALAVSRDSFRAISTSWAGLALLAGVPLLTVPVVIDQMVSSGVPLLPATPQVLGELTAPLSAELSRWVIVPLLIVFFAGELVWRERDAGLGELTDATPVPDWVPLLGKFLGLGLVLALFMALLTAAGVLAQLILGYRAFEIGLYLKVLFGLQLPEYLLFALLALLVHGLVDQKHVGHVVAIVAYVLIALAPLFGIEHNLLIYGAGPAWSYTEMRGFGASLVPWTWFKLYWAAWALLLALVARLLWVRGREGGLRVRLQLARTRFTRPARWITAAAVALIFALGGFIFYNTNLRNPYRNESRVAGRGAEYERRYVRYAGTPQPALTVARLQVDIHPQQRAVDVRGTYRLVNRGDAAIDSIHVATYPAADTGPMEFDRPATRVLNDDDLGHQVYALESPLQPGDSLQLVFLVHREPHGFREDGTDDAIAANGTAFSNSWLPAIGYQRSRELTSAAERRKYGLAPRPMIPSLLDVDASRDREAGIALEAVVSTDEGQVAVAPGALRRAWTEGGRRYFEYATDGPIGSEWTFYSADYAVREARWADSSGAAAPVTIRVYHNPQHTAHLDRMIRSVEASLAYYSRQFGPYPYGHLTIVEHPPGGTGMHADPTLISHGEGFPLWNPGEERLDLPFAVVAHEMAHQWTIPYAAVEGAPVMSESIAWYYGMKVVEHARGREQLQRLLHFFRQPYPYEPIRRGEPLLRGLDPYMSYRRGPLALYAVSEYIGEDRVNAALRRLLERHRPADARLATTLDLYRELQAETPDSLQYLLHDLFEVNTYWELATDRVTSSPGEAGAWQVTLQVRARKVVADSAGVETEVPMDDLVQVGVFGEGEETGTPLYLQMHRVRANQQEITITVPGKPARAGIDPNHLLIDLEPDDNVAVVKPAK